MYSLNRPWPADLNIEAQSVPIPGTETSTQSAIWRNNIFGPLFDKDPAGNAYPQTVYELFEDATRRTPTQPLFRRRLPLAPASPGSPPSFSRATVDTSYVAVQARRDALGSALLSLERMDRLRDPSLAPDAPSPPEIAFPGLPTWGDRRKGGARRGWAVGVWSANREEWQVVDFACHAYGLVGVSLYETLGVDVAEYITNHAPIPIIFTSANHIAHILEMAPRCPSLRAIVSMDDLDPAGRALYTQWANRLGRSLHVMSELEAWGRTPGVWVEPGPAEDEKVLDRDRIMTISYTSGTTGKPKGVISSNWNMVTAVLCNTYGTSPRFQQPGYRYLSYLPLAHMYERMMQLFTISGNGTICFSTGDVTRLLEDAQVMKPHCFPGVPRIYNRVYAAIKLQMEAPGVKGALLRRAVEAKLENWHKHGIVTHALWDRLVFRKIRALLGGEIVYMLTGSAPLSPGVHELLMVAFCADFAQGYALTETNSTATKGIPFDVGAVGTVGFVQPVNEVRLLDVPEMGYLHTDKPHPRGELLIRGDNVFPGYLHDLETTAKTLDAEGFMRTGDVADIDAEGRVKIIDRIKNVVKLAQGEYVPLERVEGIYLLDPLFVTVLVHGDSFRSSLVAVVVVDPVPGAQYVNAVLGTKITPDDIDALERGLQDKRVTAAILKGMQAMGRKHKLNGFEIVRGVHATPHPFAAHLMTPTSKLKRNVASQHFKAQIDALYDEIERDMARI